MEDLVNFLCFFQPLETHVPAGIKYPSQRADHYLQAKRKDRIIVREVVEEMRIEVNNHD